MLNLAHGGVLLALEDALYEWPEAAPTLSIEITRPRGPDSQLDRLCLGNVGCRASFFSSALTCAK